VQAAARAAATADAARALTFRPRTNALPLAAPRVDLRSPAAYMARLRAADMARAAAHAVRAAQRQVRGPRPVVIGPNPNPYPLTFCHGAPATAPRSRRGRRKAATRRRSVLQERCRLSGPRCLAGLPGLSALPGRRFCEPAASAHRTRVWRSAHSSRAQGSCRHSSRAWRAATPAHGAPPARPRDLGTGCEHAGLCCVPAVARQAACALFAHERAFSNEGMMSCFRVAVPGREMVSTW